MPSKETNDMTSAQEKLTNLEELDNKALLERGWKEISALCGSKQTPKKWTMTIPVDADRDSDVLFGEILQRFAALQKQVEMERIKRDIAKGYLRPIDIDRYEADVIATPEYKALEGDR